MAVAEGGFVGTYCVAFPGDATRAVVLGLDDFECVCSEVKTGFLVGEFGLGEQVRVFDGGVDECGVHHVFGEAIPVGDVGEVGPNLFWSEVFDLDFVADDAVGEGWLIGGWPLYFRVDHDIMLLMSVVVVILSWLKMAASVVCSPGTSG